ncbi:antitermination protein NusG [Cephaloticoccus primus]|uniref:Antitermination protein NusG n=1 Tax=Cephaloticoccus primus TaxID=1548207 RepID=A0A139SLN6_9BACT|nr:antitermination protein NusG [Cephaloticoccus primus]
MEGGAAPAGTRESATDEPLDQKAAPAVPAPADPWLVCHCKPRCEKKFAELMRAQRFEHYLPLIGSERRYGTRIKRFSKPLFPGYVFAQVPRERKALIYQQDLLARAIEVEDTVRLLAQLADIKALIASGLDFRLTPQLAKGHRVRIISGPLKGVEGQVEDPHNPRGGVLLSVDVLQQGLLVPIPAVDLKVLP